MFTARSLTWPSRSAVAALVAGTFLVGCTVSAGRTDRQAEGGRAGASVDLLAGHDWRHFAGAQVTSGSVHITPLDRRIVRQDGSGGQPNPPVNLRGPRLLVTDDFEVSAELAGTGDAPAYLQLYGEVPVVYDEWRQERPSVRLGVVGGALEVALWDGTTAKPAVTRHFGAEVPADATVTVRRTGTALRFQVGDRTVGSLPDPGVFRSGQVWFGADAGKGGPGWDLEGLRARAFGGGTVRVADAPALAQRHDDPGALRSLAAGRDRPLPMGAAVAGGPLFTDDGYRALVAGQFSMLTPENDMKPQFVHPQPDVYDFTEADSLIDFAAANDMQVHAHTLVFGEALPRWMRQVPPAGLEKVMTDHITRVVGHFRGRVAEWDVVNEPLSPDDSDFVDGKPGLRRHIWEKAMGERYIDTAFRAARAADPRAKLFLNEFGLEEDGDRWEALLSLVKRLKQRGVPIDGVGFQSHIHETGDHVDAAVFAAHVKALADLGLSSRVSEIDVHGDDTDAQAQQYSLVLRACADAPSCSSYGTWGVTDRYGSTAEEDSYPLEPGDELLWDVRLRPKPAVEALRDALAG
ncbi:endo-1,4-beta-xylanase [Streptomyces sp. NPDC046881]|uniref:endo-1,4-beta-xylanase n=1 Tax=Streptomyces sp. NPDC046881 TaxID=3155374 RepID=UPI0033F17C78